MVFILRKKVSMFAIIRSGSTQLEVKPNQVIRVDRLPLEPGAAFETDQVLLFHDGTTVRVGSPLVEGVKVCGIVLGHIKGKKVIIFKRKRRKGHRCKNGHRQQYTQVRVEQLQLS